MKCKDCDSGIRRLLDRPTGVWIHDVSPDASDASDASDNRGRVVCSDQCYVDPASSRMCELGTPGCATEGHGIDQISTSAEGNEAMITIIKSMAVLLGSILVLQDHRARDVVFSSDTAVVVGIIILMITAGWMLYDYLDK
jgi:hypothetical protein